MKKSYIIVHSRNVIFWTITKIFTLWTIPEFPHYHLVQDFHIMEFSRIVTLWTIQVISIFLPFKNFLNYNIKEITKSTESGGVTFVSDCLTVSVGNRSWPISPESQVDSPYSKYIHVLSVR